ncbi:biotin synthase [Eubacteriales bacterium]|nr:biotin synthase BioB [Faecalicatena sp. BF-R-105]GKH50878.1 biotin synthase [Eubacteriales bacterium]GKH63601.1 biotin synthase [Eubacteriales bacterium]
MTNLQALTDKVLSGKLIDKEESICLYQQPLSELCDHADKIRRHFCSNRFDICTIINGKSGHCSENCKFCAQSAHNHTSAAQYPLLPAEEILAQAKRNHDQGVLRYSIVTSGKCLSDAEVDTMCGVVRKIKEQVGISVCVSFGLLNQQQFQKLKDAGVTRVHNNLETSQRNFPNICTTHTFQDKVRAIRAAQAAGLSVCSGGIMGLGENFEDRIDMALSLRELGIQSIPVNMLNPIPGTPFENNRRITEKDMRRIVAVYRFILPTASIRLAGGRGLLPDHGKGCFLSGANAAISGDMLTTAGITTATDMKLLNELGYEVGLCNE